MKFASLTPCYRQWGAFDSNGRRQAVAFLIYSGPILLGGLPVMTTRTARTHPAGLTLIRRRVGLTVPLLLFASTPAWTSNVVLAASGNCTANVRVAQTGSSGGPQGTQFKYQISATSDERSCAVVHFSLRRSYTQENGRRHSASEPWSITVRGGSAEDQGELFESTQLRSIDWSVEDVRCQLCPR